ncbi:hypothetical protein Javan249_0032 [Streptococcus phage Javan249]|nr:hypothetical protein Javan249_0032 [Streptococcus phage Javan249]
MSDYSIQLLKSSARFGQKEKTRQGLCSSTTAIIDKNKKADKLP